MTDQSLSEQAAFELVGRSIIHCQAFEGIFVMLAKLAVAQGHAPTFADIQPISRQSFKQPTAAALKEICERTGINQDFKDRVLLLVESRNRIAHRAASEFQWPPAPEKANEFIALCNFVSEESEKLSATCHRYILSWTEKYPEFSEMKHSHMRDFGLTREDISTAVEMIRGA